MITTKAIEKIVKYLPEVIKDGTNLKAREEVAFANTLSGLAMVFGSTTSEHSLEHALSAYHHNLPHGAGLIMISRSYFKHFIDRGAIPERFIELARIFGNKNANKPSDFIIELTKLQEACGVSNLMMSDYGIKESEFEEMAISAKVTMGSLFLADPLELSLSDCINIYKESYK